MNKQFTYEELKDVVLQYGIKEKFNLVSYLVGYNDAVTREDWENIMELYRCGIID